MRVEQVHPAALPPIPGSQAASVCRCRAELDQCVAGQHIADGDVAGGNDFGVDAAVGMTEALL